MSAEELERVTLASASALAVLALLAFALTETTARTLRMQHRRGLSQRAELRRLALVAERMQALVVVTDRYDRIVWVNDAFVRISGWSLEEARGRTPADLVYSPHAEASTMADIRDAFLRGEGTRAELVHRTRDGRELWLDVDIQPVRDENGVLEGFVSVSTDITEQRRTACTDALTGLANRSVLLERLQRALERAQRHPEHRFAVLFLDFDRFKQVNDTLGHAAGDELLREVALRLEQAVRPGDAVARIARESHTAARIGGDEFVVLLERTRGVEDAMAAAQRVLAALAAPYSLASQCVHGGVSIGVVTSDITATTAEEVLCDADAAMYEAKRGGRGRCVLFDASMRERRARARAMEQELRWALRDGELDVVYQPVVDLTNDALVGVEALVRWSPPHRGAVPSEELIRAAEDAGVAEDIGQFVITRAVRDYRGWQRQLGDRAPGFLAVNVSRSQLLQPGLAGQLKQWLANAGMDASRLQLEFPERAAGEGEGDAVHPALQLLRQVGVRIALDDFGTGHASLASLRQLPLDIVKIDRSLVAQAQTVEHHRVLIEATVRVAHTLGLRTVAEGVETESQAALMQALECEQGQGWLYSHPMSAQSLERWMSERSELLAA